MFDLATPSPREVTARLLWETGLKEGMCLVVTVARDDGGLHVLAARHTTDSCSTAIELAGNLAPREKGVFVVAYCGGKPMVIARYGDTPQDLD